MKELFYLIKKKSRSRNNSCIVCAITNIEKSHTQTARLGTNTCTLNKYFFRVGFEPTTLTKVSYLPEKKGLQRTRVFEYLLYKL